MRQIRKPLSSERRRSIDLLSPSARCDDLLFGGIATYLQFHLLRRDAAQVLRAGAILLCMGLFS
jgi:hypothetical protein